MYKTYKKYFYYCGVLLFLLIAGACSKMEDTYHGFWKNGEKIYPASPDSLKAFSGKNRVLLQWLIIGDPTLSKAVIYWNNKTDSMEVPINKKNEAGVDTMNIILDGLEEGAYAFEIYTFDKYGNQSVVANVVGKVYGSSYADALLTRLVSNTSYVDDTVHITWSDPADESSIGVELMYTDTTGAARTRFIQPDADTTVIADFNMDVSRYFKYRTLFLPDTAAIDTFYTDFDNVRVLGPRTNLPQDGWSVTVSSYDNRGGRTDRLPEKLIDGNTGTSWVNLVGSTKFPHTATIDMGEKKSELFGVSLNLQSRNETPSSMSLYISDDGDNWQLLGLIPIKKEDGWQYFDFAKPESFRYFKMVFEGSYGSDNIVVDEAAVYVR